MNHTNKIYDLIVIGGGPAGMLTAGIAAQRGLSVAILEKNERLGVKLGITGKGRCNLTNTETDLKIWVAKFGSNGRFLYPAFKNFDPAVTLRFFETLGLKFKAERGGRIFPVSDSALEVHDVLNKWLKKNGVEIFFGARAVSWQRADDGKLLSVKTATDEFTAENFAICVGGKSYPSTGSSGDAYDWLREWGHTIIEPRPALVPIMLKEKWIKNLEGLSLKNVTVKVYVAGKKKAERFGEALFTHDGTSGPIILDISREVGDYFKIAPVELSLDFKPALDEKTLDARLLRDFAAANKKMLKNSLDELLPKKLIPVILKLWGVNPELPANSATKENRHKLLRLLKDLRVSVGGLGDFNQAIVTAGGVALNEIDPRTLRSKIVPNLYLAGEILDLDAPTGGYNLQMCWSTGHLAGESVE